MPRILNSINWRSHTTRGVLSAIALVLIVVAFQVFGRDPEIVASENMTRDVEVGRVADLMTGGGSLSSVAEVKSVNEARVRAEMGGRIVRVHASLGDRVSAGEILAEIENASQRAAVLQAEGAYDSAKAALRKIQGGTRAEQIALLQTAERAARAGAVNTLLSIYAGVDNAIKDSTDQIYSNPDSANPQLNISTSDSQAKLDAQNTRAQISAILHRHAQMAMNLTVDADLNAELSKTEEELRVVRAYLDTVIRVLNAGVAVAPYNDSSIAAFKADAIATRSTVNTLLGTIVTARSAIETAKKNLEQGVTGAQSEDVAAAEAAVKSAQGTYNAALASLEKTIIRSPIAGTLNNFTVKLGDFVSPTEQVAVVSNNGALEAVAYITEEDKARIQVGSKVTLENGLTGTITKIAPALDPVTRRIEVRIGLPTEATKSLTNGQSVRVQLVGSTSTSAKSTGIISIPITALKMEAERNIVLTVQNGTLVAIPITIGKLSGEFVQVTNGITPDTEIVVDARGLKEGDQVNVK